MKSAASSASRASTMLTWPCAMSRNESNTSWTQRRLPGHSVTGVNPLAHDFWTAGVPAPYRSIIAARMSRLVALHSSPEAWTWRPTKS
jgi:hypothetical protein